MLLISKELWRAQFLEFTRRTLGARFVAIAPTCRTFDPHRQKEVLGAQYIKDLLVCMIVFLNE